MPSASRPWPQASWNSVPPKPLPMTTGHGAGRRRAGVEHGDGLAGRRRAAMACAIVLVEDLEAEALAEALVAGLDDAVAARHDAHREAQARAVVGDEGAERVGDEQRAGGFRGSRR